MSRSNELVDALEFLSAIALISGMSHEEKVRYIFGIYDFDESGLLSVDEVCVCRGGVSRCVCVCVCHGVSII